MTEERIITAATVTTGEKHYGKELKKLLKKSKEAGIEAANIIGDTAYSVKENIDYAQNNNIKLISKLSKAVTHGNILNEDKFELNKDAGMYVCKDGHMAIKKARHGKKMWLKIKKYHTILMLNNVRDALLKKVAIKMEPSQKPIL